jgi:hypothetical protein
VKPTPIAACSRIDTKYGKKHKNKNYGYLLDNLNERLYRFSDSLVLT